MYPLGFLDRLTAKSYHCCVKLNGSVFIKNAELAQFGGRGPHAAEFAGSAFGYACMRASQRERDKVER